MVDKHDNLPSRVHLVPFLFIFFAPALQTSLIRIWSGPKVNVVHFLLRTIFHPSFMEIRQMVFVSFCSRTVQHKDTGENITHLAEVQESEKV